jgi:hypothetical protein
VPQPLNEPMRLNRKKRAELAVALAAALLVMVVVSGSDAWAAPATGAEVRHGSGIALLGPVDRERLLAKWKMTERLDRSYNQARILSEQFRGDFGYPWLHSQTEEVVLRAANARGDALARAWIQTGTEVVFRLERVDHSIEQLERIKDAVGPGLTDVPGSNRIFSSEPDAEHNRIIYTADRVSDALLRALAARFGTEAVAVRIEPNPRFGY